MAKNCNGEKVDLNSKDFLEELLKTQKDKTVNFSDKDNEKFKNWKTDNKEIFKEYKNDEESRILTSNFLKTLLSYPPFSNALTEKGVRISGAIFEEKLDLNSTRINEDLDLVLEYSTFKKAVNFENIVFNESMYLINNTFYCNFSLASSTIKSDLEIYDTKFKGNKKMYR